MGQKTNPTGLRLGNSYTWFSNWHNPTGYSGVLHSDLEVRKYLTNTFRAANIWIVPPQISLDKNKYTLKIDVFYDEYSKDNLKQINLAKIQRVLEQYLSASVEIKVNRVHNLLYSPHLIAQHICSELERRKPFKKIIKPIIAKYRAQEGKPGHVKGMKIQCSGRFGGSDMARIEWIREGRVPLQTFSASVEYSFEEAHTTYGIFGTKVWLYYENNK